MKIFKFGAVWCPGCIVMKPRWQEIEQELPWLKTEYFDVDESPDMKQKYNIDDVPMFVFLDKKGQEFKRMQGEISKEELIEFLNKNRDK